MMGSLIGLGARYAGMKVLSSLMIPVAAIGVTAALSTVHGCSQGQRIAGYKEAEAERLADLANANADTLGRYKANLAVIRDADSDKDAEIRRLTGVLAEKRATARPGAVCAPGCTWPVQGDKK